MVPRRLRKPSQFFNADARTLQVLDDPRKPGPRSSLAVRVSEPLLLEGSEVYCPFATPVEGLNARVIPVLVEFFYKGTHRHFPISFRATHDRSHRDRSLASA